VTGLYFCPASGAIAFKSKLQPTVATNTESEFIAPVLAAKIAKCLQASPIKLRLPPSGPTLLYEDNKAATSIVSANRHTRHFLTLSTTHDTFQDSLPSLNAVSITSPLGLY
jgi:hypothetical protein